MNEQDLRPNPSQVRIILTDSDDAFFSIDVDRAWLEPTTREHIKNGDAGTCPACGHDRQRAGVLDSVIKELARAYRDRNPDR